MNKAHAILARIGPHAALLLVACDDQETRQTAVAKAADQASESWDAARTEFLASLDPGPKHDWVRLLSGSPPARPANAARPEGTAPVSRPGKASARSQDTCSAVTKASRA